MLDLRASPTAGDAPGARCAGKSDPIMRVEVPALMGRYAGAGRRSGLVTPVPARSCAHTAAPAPHAESQDVSMPAPHLPESALVHVKALLMQQGHSSSLSPCL